MGPFVLGRSTLDIPTEEIITPGTIIGFAKLLLIYSFRKTLERKMFLGWYFYLPQEGIFKCKSLYLSI